MTIIENRAAADTRVTSGVEPQARALLVRDSRRPDAPERPAVVISTRGKTDELDEMLRVALPHHSVDGLPVIDSWIIDLSLRDERIAVVTTTDVLTSVPLLPIPDGWTAAVAAQGLLGVVISVDSETPAFDASTFPARALRSPFVLAARVPVCLS